MSKCETCEGWGPFQCSYCKAYFCNEHLPPHKHYCTSVSKEEIISEIVDRATLQETSIDALAYIARIAVLMTLIAGFVLTIDVFALLLFNWNVDTLIMLLWYEGVAMAFFGGAGWWWGRERPYPLPTPMGTKLYRMKLKVQHPWFWVSLGMAGFILILVGFLIWQFH